MKVSIRAALCEEFFNTVSANAKDVGISVNVKKTQVLCISAVTGSDVDFFIKFGSGDVQKGQNTLKQLGFVFGRRPNAEMHVKNLMTKFRQRIWIIRHLKKALVPKEDLMTFYRTFVLPMLDHIAVVYHTLITGEQASRLEELQSRTLKIIFGNGRRHSYTELLEEAGVERLSERRLRLLHCQDCQVSHIW